LFSAVTSTLSAKIPYLSYIPIRYFCLYLHFYRLQKYNFSWFQQNNSAKQSKNCFFTSERGTAASSSRTGIRQDSLITKATPKHCRRAEAPSARRQHFYFAMSGKCASHLKL